MTPELLFVVPGDAVGKERPRVVTRVGKKARVYTPTRTKEFEGRVRYLAAAACGKQRWRFLASDRFRVEVRIFRRFADRGPDIDNVVKAVLDALNGVVWVDDAHVRELETVICQAEKNPLISVLVRKLLEEA